DAREQALVFQGPPDLAANGGVLAVLSPATPDPWPRPVLLRVLRLSMATSEHPWTRHKRRMTLLARCASGRLRTLYLRQQRLFSSSNAWMRPAYQPRLGWSLGRMSLCRSYCLIFFWSWSIWRRVRA